MPDPTTLPDPTPRTSEEKTVPDRSGSRIDHLNIAVPDLAAAVRGLSDAGVRTYDRTVRTTVEDLPGGPGSVAAPAVGWARGPLGAVQAAERAISRGTAARARAVAAFADTRPSSADRRPGEPGCASAESRAARPEVMGPVSEWAAQELMIALSVTRQRAETLLTESLTLVHQLPSTLVALEDGRVHTGHLRVLLDRVASIGDDMLRECVEADLLDWLAARDVTTAAQLGDRARRLVLARDPLGAAQRLADAIRERGVSCTSGPADGMSSLTAVLSTPEARACLDVLGRLADSVADEPGPDGAAPRTRAQRMADCLVDLVLRPGETALPVVAARLTVVASVETLAGGDQPGEVDGEPAPAELVRALARSLGLVPDDPATAPGPEPALASGGAVPPLPAAAPFEDAAWDWDDAWAAFQGWLHDGQVEPDWCDAPDPGPGALLPPGEVVVPVEWVTAPDADADADSAADASSDNGIDNARDVGPPGGAWAEADAAVLAASLAAEDARRALGRALRRVGEAEAAAVRDEQQVARSPQGAVSRARDTLAAMAHATEDRRRAIGALLVRTGGGGLLDRPRVAVVDGLSGALLALSDGPELRRRAHCGRRACDDRTVACTHDLTSRSGLRPPPATDGYRPSAALDRFVRARDRRCRFPGCRMRVQAGELDHLVPYPDGATAAGNLHGFCTHHHRGKHQAPGWSITVDLDGRLRVTTPSGLTARTDAAPALDVSTCPP